MLALVEAVKECLLLLLLEEAKWVLARECKVAVGWLAVAVRVDVGLEWHRQEAKLIARWVVQALEWALTTCMPIPMMKMGQIMIMSVVLRRDRVV
jgi:DhnA family fructose-bisphosphate aldolase class Ia